MATVEDIYHKIRRGETAGLKFSRPSEEDLAAGVERIRARLNKRPVISENPPGIFRYNRVVWLAPAALAAIALVAVMLIPRENPVLVPSGFAIGTTSTFGAVAVHVLTPSKIEHEFTGGKLSLKLLQGAIAVKRTSPDTALDISTPHGTLTAQGTAFIIEHGTQTSIELTEGRLAWQKEGRVRILDKKNPRLGRDLAELRKLVPEAYMQFPAKRADALPESAQPSAGAFKKNDCVIYTVNGSRREGKIREVLHGEYRLAHEGIDEPDLFPGSSLIRCGKATGCCGQAASTDRRGDGGTAGP